MSTNVRQILFPLLAAFFWGLAFAGQDVCADYLGAFNTVSIRHIFATLTLLPFAIFAWRRGRGVGVTEKVHPSSKPQGPGLSQSHQPSELCVSVESLGPCRFSELVKAGAVLGAFLCITLTFQQLGMNFGTEGGKAGFLAALYVVFVPILGLFLGRKVGAKIWVAILICLVGLYFLCIKSDLTFDSSDLFVIIAAVSDSCQIILMERYANKFNPFQLACSQFFFVALYSTIGMLAFEGVQVEGIIACLPQLLYLGVISSGVAFTLQIFSQKGTNPTIVSLIFCLESVFAVLGGAVFLEQSLTGRETLGCVLMFAAAILSQLPLEKAFKKQQND